MKPGALAALIGAAAVAAIGAWFALDENPGAARDARAGAAVAPPVTDAARIRVAEAGAEAVLEKRGETWVVPAFDDYPAEATAVRRALAGLGTLTYEERRTARAENHARLSLGEPDADSGAARWVRIENAAGETLVSVLLGDRGPDLGAQGGTVYLRAPDEDQVWLARGAVDASADPIDWVEDLIIDIRQERLAEIAILDPREGPAYAALRETFDQENPVLRPLPAGRDMKSEGAARTLAFALESVRFTGVRARPADTAAARPVARLTTFDGLALTVSALAIDGEATFLFDAAAVDPAADLPEDAFVTEGETDPARLQPAASVAAEAEALRAALSPWAFILADFRADRFSKPIAEMLDAPAN